MRNQLIFLFLIGFSSVLCNDDTLDASPPAESEINNEADTLKDSETSVLETTLEPNADSAAQANDIASEMKSPSPESAENSPNDDSSQTESKPEPFNENSPLEAESPPIFSAPNLEPAEAKETAPIAREPGAVANNEEPAQVVETEVKEPSDESEKPALESNSDPEPNNEKTLTDNDQVTELVLNVEIPGVNEELANEASSAPVNQENELTSTETPVNLEDPKIKVTAIENTISLPAGLNDKAEAEIAHEDVIIEKNETLSTVLIGSPNTLNDEPLEKNISETKAENSVETNSDPATINPVEILTESHQETTVENLEKKVSQAPAATETGTLTASNDTKIDFNELSNNDSDDQEKAFKNLPNYLSEDIDADNHTEGEISKAQTEVTQILTTLSASTVKDTLSSTTPKIGQKDKRIRIKIKNRDKNKKITKAEFMKAFKNVLVKKKKVPTASLR